MFLKRYILTIFLLIGVLSLYAQQIQGVVTDVKGQPLSFVSVALLSSRDSSVVSSSITGEDGSFVLPIEMDEGIIRTSLLGYKTYYTAIKNGNVGAIVMQEDSRTLGEVTVSAGRIVQNKNGYSVRLSGTGLEKLSSAQETLPFLPGVSMRENRIMLLDRLPVIYVNGVKIMSQDELSSLLPARIEKIEVDYLAVGEGATEKGGTIRITTKKEMSGGYSGYLREELMGTPKYGHLRDAPTVTFDASVGRWTFNYYMRYNHQKLLEDATRK